MMAWYSRERSSFNSSASRSREISFSLATDLGIDFSFELKDGIIKLFSDSPGLSSPQQKFRFVFSQSEPSTSSQRRNRSVATIRTKRENGLHSPPGIEPIRMQHGSVLVVRSNFNPERMTKLMNKKFAVLLAVVAIAVTSAVA